MQSELKHPSSRFVLRTTHHGAAIRVRIDPDTVKASAVWGLDLGLDDGNSGSNV